MEKDQEQLEALRDIRKMMKDSSKFLSLSGLSGIIAGIYALAGAYAGYLLIQNNPGNGSTESNRAVDSSLMLNIIIVCAAVLLLSLLTAYFLSARKAKKLNQSMFDHTSKKVFWNMSIPLAAGGVFCFSLLYNHLSFMVSPVMLLFYGMALLNSSKYTIPEIKYLGILEICMGLMAGFFPGQGLLFWALGFGVLHIIYGSIMWNKYDRHI
jgi:hypothetical protein